MRGWSAFLAAGLALAGLGACLQQNPAFDRDEGASESGSSSAGATLTATTSGGNMSDSESGPFGSSTTSGTSADLTTGGGLSSPWTVPATIGTCIYFASPLELYGPPEECEAGFVALNATAQTGLIGIDTELDSVNGGGRTAAVVLRFDLPAELAGAVIIKATLELRAADGVEAEGDGGSLWTAAPFDAVSLVAGPPMVQIELASPIGPVAIDSVVTWDIDPGFVTGPAVYLELLPTSTNAAIYRGHNSANDTPRLVLDLQQ